MRIFKTNQIIFSLLFGILMYLLITFKIINSLKKIKAFIDYFQDFKIEENEPKVLLNPKSETEMKLLKKQLEVALENARNETYKILIWEPPFGARDQRVVDEKNCGSCEISYNKELVDDPATKAIVFHFNEFSFENLPETRSSHQYYVWWTMESPATVLHAHGKQLDNVDKFFNLTMTHRRDSDIFSFYGHAKNALRRIQNNGKINVQTDIDDLIQNKQELAIWIVSNCGNAAGARLRMKYTDELVKAGLRLHRRGKCFPQNGQIEVSDVTRYKFYLAFENSFHCKDYITEKLFHNAFEMGSVPVVLGAKKSDYEPLVPPGSCIYAEDFKSQKNLVNFLNYLDNNETAYRDYFKWRLMNVNDMPMSGLETDFCQLCRVLHGINIDNIYNRKFSEIQSYIPLFGYSNKSRVVSSLKNWFYDEENEMCLNLVNYDDIFGKTKRRN